MKYGIRFVYVGGNLSTEMFYDTEIKRNKLLRELGKGGWNIVLNCGKQVVNLANVAYCEQIER